jgi:thymidylate synthase
MTHQYIELCKRILNEGEYIFNERTGKNCLTLINADLEYNVGAGEFPLVTTRKSFFKSAIAEMIGYLRGYDNAEDFRNIGTNTWNANANLNDDWLGNLARKGDDDMGRVYGVQGRSWMRPDGKSTDQLAKLISNLSNGIDDRGEILSFYNPGEFDLGCLRPCMHTHTFSLVNGTLNLTSYQRSCDAPLGLVFNMIQVYFLLAIVARITGNKPGMAYHKIVNAHMYEDQVELMKMQVEREVKPAARLIINQEIKTLNDLETWVSMDDFSVADYEHHNPIKYPFSV